MCLHLRLYCGVDVTMIVNEVNKFGQIFPIHRRRDENARIWGNFHPFDFTPKSHLPTYDCSNFVLCCWIFGISEL
jgi:hypothetical protein